MSAPADSAARTAALEAQLAALRERLISTANSILGADEAPDVRSACAHGLWISACGEYERWRDEEGYSNDHDEEAEQYQERLAAFYARLTAFNAQHGLPAPAPYDEDEE